MNISLPDPLKRYVDREVEEGGYGSSSEYIRELIRRDQARRELRELVLAGARSPIVGEVDEAHFEALRRTAREPRDRSSNRA